MNPRLFDQCCTYLLAHAVTAPADEPQPAPRAVTISRETGAGAITIGELVARTLQERGIGDPRRPWAVFDRNLVKQVLGRDLDKARMIALCDAMVQSNEFAGAVEARVVAPLRAALHARQSRRSAEAAATRVDFYTMVRGEG